MEIITLLLVLVLTRFTIRGFFNTEWRGKAQEKIDSIKKRRVFWNLVNGFDGSVFDIDWIFTIYLDHNRVRNAPLFSVLTEEDRKIRDLIKDNGMTYDLVGENVKVLNKAIEEREEIIRDLIDKRSLTYTNAEIKKAFSEDQIGEQYEKFVSIYFDLLPDRGPMPEEHKRIWKELEDKSVFPVGSLKHSTSDEYNLTEIWEARKRLSTVVGGFEYTSEDKQVDSPTIFFLKKAQVNIGKVVANLLCEDVINEKVEDTKTRGILKNTLKEWEQLHMLRWCIQDFSVVAWMGTSGFQRFIWRVVESISSSEL